MATRYPFKNSGVLGVPISVDYGDNISIEKVIDASTSPPVDDNGEKLSSLAQDGVRKMQATTTVWTPSHLVAAYIL